MAWMTANGFFESEDFGLSREDVLLEETRKEKLERIQNLGCAYFIDDLEEVFPERSFPNKVRKVLYAPTANSASIPGVWVAANWQEITDYLFEHYLRGC